MPHHTPDECTEAAEREIAEKADPVLAMLGVGKHLWEAESGDSFVERLRSSGLG